MMIKIITAALMTSLVLNAGAMVVSDPGSYHYHVEQITMATKQLNELTKQVQTLGGIKTATDDVKRQIYRVQDDFTMAMNNLVRAQQGLADSILNTDETVDKLFSTDRDSITTSPSDGGVIYRDTAEFLDEVYERTGTMGGAEFLHINDERLRRQVRKDVGQLALRRLLFDQDDFKQRQQERIDRTTEIMEKMQNQSDPSMIQTQINTAMLLQELVQVQTEMLELQKAAVVAYAYMNYQGVDFSEVKTNLEALKDDDDNRREAWHEERRHQTPAFDALPREKNLDSLYGY